MKPPFSFEKDEIVLRPADSQDFDFLFSLHTLTFRTYVEQTWGRWDDAEQLNRFRKDFDRSYRRIIVLRGEDIGCIWTEDQDSLIFVDYIAVLPEYQRRGLGTKLVRQVLAQADERGIPVCLNVLKVNPARSLYERLGFRVVGGDEHRHYMQRTAGRD
jgi:ribosomal protein S18 acetylase RimI-like enzyme